MQHFQKIVSNWLDGQYYADMECQFSVILFHKLPKIGWLVFYLMQNTLYLLWHIWSVKSGIAINIFRLDNVRWFQQESGGVGN